MGVLYARVAGAWVPITAVPPGTGTVAPSRRIDTNAPLTGGGDLSANRTLDISTFTTAARGAVPAPGAATGKLLRDDGTWTATPPWNSAWGFIGGPTSTPTEYGNGNTANETPILAVTVNPMPSGFGYVEGRRVRITMIGTMRGSVPGDYFHLRIRRHSGTGGTLVAVQSIHIQSGVGYYTPFTLTCIDQMSTAASSPSGWTFNIQRVSGTGNLGILGNDSVWNQMTIEDIGPVTRI